MGRPHPPSGTRRLEERVVVGSRGSALALRQTEEVLDQLRAARPTTDFQVLTIKTGGDAASDAPLATLRKGMFVSEIEAGLLAGDLDMAVHSLKDMPTVLPDGLTIGAVIQRQDPRDVLADRWNRPLGELPPGARIGTSSPRRTAQLRALRSDLEVLPIRGNVDTRLRKAKGDDYDGVVLAAAGILRMGLEDEIAEYLSPEDFVPAPGQGALAVEVRQDSEELLAFLAAINHSPTRQAVTAERAFLEVLGGSCQLPAGAYARIGGNTMVMTVFLGFTDRSRVFKAKVRGRADVPHEVALDAHERLVEKGAGPLLKS